MELPTGVQIIVSVLGALAPYAWPSVVLAGLLLFRKQLSKLVSRVENAKLPGGSEVSFKKELEEVEQEERSALPPAATAAELEDDSKSEPEPRIGQDSGDEQHDTAGAEEAGSEADGERRTVGELGPAAYVSYTSSEALGLQTPNYGSFRSPIDLRELASISPEAAVLMAYKRIEHALSRVAAEEGMGMSRRHTLPPMSELRMIADTGRLSDRDISILAELRRLRNIAAHHQASDLDYESAARYLDLADDQLRRMARLRVMIRNNAVVAGAFPPGGPWVRDGNPPLADGEHEIVRHGDGTWRLLSNREAVVFRPVWQRPVP